MSSQKAVDNKCLRRDLQLMPQMELLPPTSTTTTHSHTVHGGQIFTQLTSTKDTTPLTSNRPSAEQRPTTTTYGFGMSFHTPPPCASSRRDTPNNQDVPVGE